MLFGIENPSGPGHLRVKKFYKSGHGPSPNVFNVHILQTVNAVNCSEEVFPACPHILRK